MEEGNKFFRKKMVRDIFFEFQISSKEYPMMKFDDTICSV
jgi:hypothetical protein